MDESRLYLLEILVSKIRFAPPYVHFPNKDEINIFVTFKNFISMHIISEDCAATQTSEEEFMRRELNLNFRKSQAFYCKPEQLLLALNQAPLDLYFTAKWKPVPFGKMNIPWALSFLNLAEKSRWHSTNQLAPVCVKKAYELWSHEGAQIGEVEVCLVLSCPAVGTTVL